MAYVEIGPAVAVEVGPSSTRRPGNALVQFGFGADILEAFAFDISEECDASPAHDQQVGVTIAVEITHRDTVRKEPGFPARQMAQPHFHCDILESVVTQIAKEFARQADNLLLVFSNEVPSAGDKDVWQAVAIVVEYPNAAAQRFKNRQMILVFAVAVGHFDAAGFGDVRKDRWTVGLFGHFCGPRGTDRSRCLSVRTASPPTQDRQRQ